MPTDNNANGAALPGKERKKDRKHGKSIGWIIGVVVLILISVTFILPTTIFSVGNTQKIVFGSYNGEDIALELSYDNYFYNQLYALSQTSPMNAQNMMQFYYQAFYQTVYYTALSQMAKEAGITVSDSMLASAVVDSFRTSDGSIDMEAYNSAAQVDKDAMMNQVKGMIPAQLVYSDIVSVKTANAEYDFVSSLNSAPRTFQYITVDYDSYPDADAAAYAEADPAPFMTKELSMITVATEAEADEILASIRSGEKQFADAAAESSIDAYSSENGAMGSVVYHSLEDMLMNAEDAATVFAIASGEVSEPIQGYAGWMLFLSQGDAAAADPTDPDTLSDIKRYISLEDAETMDAWVKAEADEVYAAASADFDAAAAEYGLAVTEVGASSYNPASASFINDIAGNDPEGLLYNAAASNADFQKSIFTAAEGAVIGPQAAGSSYIIVRPGATDASDSNGWNSYLDLMYSASSETLAAQDLQTGILMSDSFTDNFITTFLSDVMMANQQ